MFMEKREKERVAAADLIRKSEPEANLIVSYMMYTVSSVYLLGLIFLLTGVFHAVRIIYFFTIGNVIIIPLVSTLCILKKGQGAYFKNLLFGLMLLSILEFNIYTGFKTWLLFSVPIIVSCRYYNKRLTISTGIHTIFIVLLCTVANAHVGPSLGLLDLNVVNYDNPVTYWIQTPLYDSVIHCPEDQKRLYIDSFRLMFLPNSIFCALITALCYVLISHGQKLIIMTWEAAEANAKLENEIIVTRTKNMMSQIQPHFIFNALTAIMAIDGNPEETIESIATFGRYLRENLNTLTEEDVIDFKKEMTHVQVYVDLEQMRFKNKINLQFDLEVMDFKIPSLTVQILVENAIKHGITRQKDGGTIVVTSIEKPDCYLITVQDNGVGFDLEKVEKENNHFGLKNIRTRLQILCDGTLTIESKIGTGTKATVCIPKQQAD